MKISDMNAQSVAVYFVSRRSYATRWAHRSTIVLRGSGVSAPGAKAADGTRFEVAGCDLDGRIHAPHRRRPTTASATLRSPPGRMQAPVLPAVTGLAARMRL